MVYFGNKPMTRHIVHLCGSLQDEALVYNNVRCILNKLTPEKFETLACQISALPVLRSPTLIARIIDLIIDKASEEELYSNLYAEFCRVLSINDCLAQTNQESEEDELRQRRLGFLLESQTHSRFETVLIEKCSNLFGRYLHHLELNPENRSEDEQRVFRKKAVGFMKFIGELYRSEVLSNITVAEMLEATLTKSHINHVELVAKLLTIAGQLIERAAHVSDELKNVWPGVWAWLDRASEESHVLNNTRLRYIIYDIVELKSNEWTMRKSVRDHQPSRLADIRLQLETESSMDIEMAVKSQQALANKIEEELVTLLEDTNRSLRQIYTRIRDYGHRRYKTTKGCKQLVVFALTRAVVRTSLDETGVLDVTEEKLKLLRDTIEADIELEAVCINALQNLIIVCLGSPQGLLYKAFNCLYESKVLSIEGFIRWKEGPEFCEARIGPELEISPFLLGSEGRGRATVIAAAYMLSL